MLRETPSLGRSARERDARWLAWTARASSAASWARAVLTSLAASSLSRRARSWPLSTRSPDETRRSAMRPAMRKEASAEEAAFSSPASRGAGSLESVAVIHRTGRTGRTAWPESLAGSVSQPPRPAPRRQRKAQSARLAKAEAGPRLRAWPACRGCRAWRGWRMAAFSRLAVWRLAGKTEGDTDGTDGTSRPPAWQGR